VVRSRDRSRHILEELLASFASLTFRLSFLPSVHWFCRKKYAEYSVKVDPDQDDKATEIRLCNFKRPHMRYVRVGGQSVCSVDPRHEPLVGCDANQEFAHTLVVPSVLETTEPFTVPGSRSSTRSSSGLPSLPS
jgi:hypothetical protein